MGDNPVHTSDSKSLWNYTLSPGWTDKEIEVFVAAISKYGVGRWTKITKERILPGKTVAQMYNQCQRLVGQQSLAEFEGLKLNLKAVFEKNAAIQGKGIVRKNNCIVNQGDKQTREMVLKKKAYNKENFGLTQEEINAIVIPELKHEDTSSVFVNSASTGLNSNPGQKRLEKIQRLKMLQKELSLIETQIAKKEKLEADPNYQKKQKLKKEKEQQSRKLSFRKVGQKIAADCGWGDYYPGRITKVNNDGTVNITFKDGEKVENVQENQIKNRSSNSSSSNGGVKRKANKTKTDTKNSDPFEKVKKKKSKKRNSRKASEKTDEEKSIELALKLMQSEY